MERVLLAMDGSEHHTLIDQVQALMQAWPHAHLTIVYVTPDEPRAFGSTPLHYEEIRSEKLEHTARVILFPRYSERLQFLHLYGHPATVICDTAESQSADVIVIGSHKKHALDRFLLGSVSRDVVNRSKRPVLVVKE